MGSEQLTLQQQAAVLNRGGALLVSAAAGSGKTKVLVERLFHYILQEGRNIDDFLIITYTRAAAAELRGKIAAELNRRFAQQPENRHLQAQLFRVYQAEIKTVDAFCAGLLRENIHLLAQPGDRHSFSPDFRVLDQEEGQQLQQRCMHSVLDEFYAHIAEEAGSFQLAETLGAGRDDQGLETLLLQLEAKVQSHAYPQRWIVRQEEFWEKMCSETGLTFETTVYGQEIFSAAKASLAHWRQLLENTQALLRGHSLLEERYLPGFESLTELLREMEQCPQWDRLAALLQLEMPKLRPVKDVDGGEEKQHAQAVWKGCKDMLGRLREDFSIPQQQMQQDLCAMAPAMLALMKLLRNFLDACRQEKLRRDVMDFSDQEHGAIQLLYAEDGKPTALAQRLSRRYAEVLVDEYQDSNEVQNYIFRAVSGEGRRLFAVGDVKQSIYRFRLADPTIFLRDYQSYADYTKAEAGEPRKITLSKNFRSREEVLSATNFVFENILSREMGELDYGPEERLHCGAEYYLPAADRETEFHLLCMPKQSDDGIKLKKDQAEADYIAQRIRQLLDEPFLVQEGDMLRPIRPEDIAILLRSPNTRQRVLVQALTRQGISCAQPGGEDLFSTVEVQVMIHLLEVLDNPHQDIPLLSLLRSPLLQFTPDRLARIRCLDLEGDWYQALQADSEEDTVRLLAELDRLRRVAQDTSMDRLLWHIYNEWNVLGIFGAMPGGEQRKNNLIAFFDYTRHYEDNGYKGLFRYVTQLRRVLEQGGQQEKNGTAGGSGVQIMSIHKSKGLEFPVVILADLAKDFNERDYSAAVLVHPQMGLGPDCVDTQLKLRFPSCAKQALRSRMRRESRAEEMRLLYVGMTRAKEKLIMIGSLSNAASRLKKLAVQASCPVLPEAVAERHCYLDWILMPLLCRTEAAALRELAGAEPLQKFSGGDLWKILLSEAQPPQKEQILFQRPVKNGLPWEREILDYVYPYERECHTPAKRTVTQLKGREVDREIAEEAEKVLPSQPLSRPRFLQSQQVLDPAQRGTAMHLAMQFLNFQHTDSREEIRRQIEDLCHRRIMTRQQAEAIDDGEIFRFFASELGKEVREAKKVWREFRFNLLISAKEVDDQLSSEDEMMLQGVVDCCWETPEGITVLDFKTDRVFSERLRQRAEEYRFQVEQYAKALSRIMGKKVSRRLLYFFEAGCTIEL